MREHDSSPAKKRRTEGPKTMNPVSNLRILVVDNLISYRQKLKGWLTEAGVRPEAVAEAGLGVEGLELIAQMGFEVDVVICEWDDQEVNGAEMVEQLRRTPQTQHMAFIALAGNDPAAIRAAKAAGANEVVVKPVTQMELLKALTLVQRSIKPRGTETKKRLAAVGGPVPEQSTKLSSTIASELRSAGKVGRVKSQTVIAKGPYRNRLYWVEQGSIFVREQRQDGTTIEYRATAGRFFGEASFVNEPIESLFAVAEVPSIIGYQEKDSVLMTIQRLPILQHYFKTITADRYRNNVVVELPEDPSGGGGGLKGTLESLAFPDLTQMLIATKKTGVLRIESAGDTASLYYSGGVLRHAELNGDTGEDVVYRVISWPGGRFAFTAQAEIPEPVTITIDANALLMEGLRRRDQGA